MQSPDWFLYHNDLCRERVTLILNEHVRNTFTTKLISAIEIIGSVKKLTLTLPSKCLLIIYKASVRPHLDYAVIIYDNQKMNPSKTCYRKFNTMQL